MLLVGSAFKAQMAHIYYIYIFGIICHIAQWQLLTKVAQSHRHVYLKICQQIRVMFTLRRRPLDASKPAGGQGRKGMFDLVCFCLVATWHHKSLSGMNYCWRLERARSAKVSLLGLMSLPWRVAAANKRKHKKWNKIKWNVRERERERKMCNMQTGALHCSLSAS